MDQEKQEEIVKTIKDQTKKEEPSPETQQKQASILGKLSEVEAMLNRTSEIKKDSIKLKILENIHNELKNLNIKFDTLNETIKSTLVKRNDFY